MIFCQLILEVIVCRYGCVRKIVADRGELNSNEAGEFLLYTLWANKSTHSLMTWYMLIELMTRQTPIMLIEEKIATWAMLHWSQK